MLGMLLAGAGLLACARVLASWQYVLSFHDNVMVISIIGDYSTGQLVPEAEAVAAASAATSQDEHDDNSKNGREAPPLAVLKPVDCSVVSDIEPVNTRRMRSNYPPHYFVSFAWWDVRLKRGSNPIVQANPTVKTIQGLLMNTKNDGAFIDVGGNVGFMSMFAYSQNRTVYAFDPISYNIAKLCEGQRANDEKGPTVGIHTKESAEAKMLIYHAACGSESGTLTISRPPDNVGKFDQASAVASSVNYGNRTVTEVVPQVTVDSIVPADTPVAVVKIDVQGYEEHVVRGMTQILSRKTGYPKFIFFEEAGLAQKAGLEPGGTQRIIESHGYTCERDAGKTDILCQK